MTKEKFINRIKELKINVPDEKFFLEYNKEIYDILDNQEKLIKYLEHRIRIYENRVMEHGFDDDIIKMNCYQDILERIKSGKYE